LDHRWCRHAGSNSDELDSRVAQFDAATASLALHAKQHATSTA
jgi:hypothetical protein